MEALDKLTDAFQPYFWGIIFPIIVLVAIGVIIQRLREKRKNKKMIELIKQMEEDKKKKTEE